MPDRRYSPSLSCGDAGVIVCACASCEVRDEYAYVSATLRVPSDEEQDFLLMVSEGLCNLGKLVGAALKLTCCAAMQRWKNS